MRYDDDKFLTTIFDLFFSLVPTFSRETSLSTAMLFITIDLLIKMLCPDRDIRSHIREVDVSRMVGIPIAEGKEGRDAIYRVTRDSQSTVDYHRVDA